MATVAITCPHCGLTKEVPKGQIPPGAIRITCPRCGESFVLENSPGSVTPPEKAPHPPPHPLMMTVTCPHCGLMKEAPIGAIPAGAKVTCPRCRDSFIFGKSGEAPATPNALDNTRTSPPAAEAPKMAAPSPPVPPPDPIRRLVRKKELSGLGELFVNAWQIYKRRALTLICLILIVIIPFVALAGALFLIHGLFPEIQTALPQYAAVILAGITAILTVSFWAGAAFVFALVDESLTVREALGKGWRRLGPFIWLILISQFIVSGGYMLLLIPGLLFTVWFFFGQFILAEDDERGMNALLKSKEYIKGHLVGVSLRLIVTWLLAVVISVIPIIGPFVLLLFVPFASIFTCLVYRDLREIKGDIHFPSSAGEKFKWIGAGLLGYVMIPVIFFAFMGTALLTLLSFEKALFKPLEDYGKAVMSAPSGKPPEMPLLLKMAVEGSDVVPASITAAQYDALLASQKADFESGTKVSVGPAAILLDHFWDDAKAPHVWLKVRVAPLPNLDLGGKFARLIVERVPDRENRDIYDPANTFESEFFQRLSLSRQDGTSPCFESIRNVHLRTGAKESDIAGIEGTLIFTLPEGIETLTLDASMKGKEATVAGAKVTLKEMAGGKVSLEFHGDFSRHIKTVGYNLDGKPLPNQGSSSTTNGDVTSFNPAFGGDVHSVKVIVASSFVERKYPFVLKR